MMAMIRRHTVAHRHTMTRQDVGTCRPYVVLKIATSLDGRVVSTSILHRMIVGVATFAFAPHMGQSRRELKLQACADKTSQWITQAERHERTLHRRGMHSVLRYPEK